MKLKTVITRSAEETKEFARNFASTLVEGDVIALIGNLGSGKTTFVQGLAVGLDIEDNVNSPTFKIINEFTGRLPLYHFDFYRMTGEDDLLKIGFEHYVFGNGITIIEWADKFPKLIPDNVYSITFSDIEGESDSRVIDLEKDK